jgi:Dockerin type I domain
MSVGVGSLNISGMGEFLAGNIQFNTGRPSKTVLNPLNDSLSISGGTLSVGSIGQNVGSTNLVCTVSFIGGTVTANTFRMALNQQGGTLSPGAGGLENGGASVGSMTLLDDSTGKQGGVANYTEAPAAHLLLDVGSGTSDVVHLENNGNFVLDLTATLNGEIDVNVAHGYTASIGDTFNVLTADSILGSPTVRGSILQIVFLGHARPGDATRNETIDSNDFAALAAHYDQSGAGIGWGEGDFNGDGTVNALDFNALATNYGKGGTVENPIGADVPDAAVALGSVVPEPVSASILFGAMGIGLMGRHRRRTI